MNDRYQTSWYSKRIKQNQKIKKFLIDKITDHQELSFPWSKAELRYLNYEDLFEIAVAAVNKKVKITLGTGSDLSNGHDCKFSIARRCSNRNRVYAAAIRGCSKKEHILACVYEGMQEKFYFFSFPATINEHNIPFDRDTGEPKRSNYMWEHECLTFEEMAKAK